MPYRLIVVIFSALLLLVSLIVGAQDISDQCDVDVNYLEQGRSLIATGDYQNAISRLTCAVDIQPANPENYYYRAFAYMLLDKFNQAISDYNLFISRTDDANALYYQAFLYRGLAHSSLDNTEQALSDVTTVIDNGGNVRNVEVAYSIRASIYRDRGEFERAIDNYDEAIAIDPTQARLYSNRGFIYYDMGRIDRATDDWVTAFDRDTDLTDSYRTTAALLTRRGAYDDAIEQLNEAILLDAFAGNFRWENYLARSKPHLELNNHLQALLDANTALSVNSSAALELEPQILLVRSEAYLNLERYDEALEDVNRYLEIAGDNYEAYRIRGDIYYQLENYEQALDDYRRYRGAIADKDVQPVIQRRINELQE